MWSVYFFPQYICESRTLESTAGSERARCLICLRTQKKTICVVALSMVKRHAQCHSADCSLRNSLCSTMPFAEYLRALQLFAPKVLCGKIDTLDLLKCNVASEIHQTKIRRILGSRNLHRYKRLDKFVEAICGHIKLPQMNVLHYLFG